MKLLSCFAVLWSDNVDSLQWNRYISNQVCRNKNQNEWLKEYFKTVTNRMRFFSSKPAIDIDRCMRDTTFSPAPLLSKYRKFNAHILSVDPPPFVFWDVGLNRHLQRWNLQYMKLRTLNKKAFMTKTRAQFDNKNMLEMAAKLAITWKKSKHKSKENHYLHYKVKKEMF